MPHTPSLVVAAVNLPPTSQWDGPFLLFIPFMTCSREGLCPIPLAQWSLPLTFPPLSCPRKGLCPIPLAQWSLPLTFPLPAILVGGLYYLFPFPDLFQEGTTLLSSLIMVGSYVSGCIFSSLFTSFLRHYAKYPRTPTPFQWNRPFLLLFTPFLTCSKRGGGQLRRLGLYRIPPPTSKWYGSFLLSIPFLTCSKRGTIP